jgi:hypothetical protein
MNSDNPIWTIGIVNYKSSVYLKYQLKILYEFNDITDFKLIIIDNSAPFEKDELETLITPYQKYNNCEIVYFNASQEPLMRGSGQHGEGLTEVLKRTDTEFLLVHDPDFFFVEKNYLKILESELRKGSLSVGAPYRNTSETGKIGNPDFPSAFGAAYVTSEIKDLDFNPSLSREKFDGMSSCWIEPEGADVGWKIRDLLSKSKYKSFSQKPKRILRCLGKYTHKMLPYAYYLNGKLIAYHLFRGTFVDSEMSFMNSDITKSAPQEWNLVRKRFACFFYNEIKGGVYRVQNRVLIFSLKVYDKLHKSTPFRKIG